MQVLIHYGEIALKGKNRAKFENKLIENIKEKFKQKINVVKRYGRLICSIDASKEEIIKKLSLTPGIEYFAFVKRCKHNIEEIKKTALKLLEGKKCSFKVNTKRSYKNFPLTSLEVNKLVGSFISEKLNMEVNLKNPEVIVNIEITEKECLLYLDKIIGVGGLPIDITGKVIALLSGGIDSPVASFLAMKRGCKILPLHFLNRTINSQEGINKIKKIVKTLANIQGNTKLYIVDFTKIQQEIIKYVPSEYRMIIYRRFMNFIANEIANKEDARAIITGDNLGQVASQTLENLLCIYNASKLPVFAPLIAYDKKEIIQLAKKIKTYDISIIPYADCCSFMIAKHPKTKAKLEEVLKIETRIENKEQLIEDAVNNARVILIS